MQDSVWVSLNQSDGNLHFLKPRQTSSTMSSALQTRSPRGCVWAGASSAGRDKDSLSSSPEALRFSDFTSSIATNTRRHRCEASTHLRWLHLRASAVDILGTLTCPEGSVCSGVCELWEKRELERWSTQYSGVCERLKLMEGDDRQWFGVTFLNAEYQTSTKKIQKLVFCLTKCWSFEFSSVHFVFSPRP